MKFRSKLSFSAFVRCITIEEMFLIAILKSYQTHVAQGDVTNQMEYTEEANKMFSEQIGDELDVRGAKNGKPFQSQEEIDRAQKDKGFISRKHKKSEKNKNNKCCKSSK